MAEGIVPSKKVYARIGRAVKHFEQTYINPGLRGEKVVRARRESCRPRNEKWKFTIIGTPTGGSFSFSQNVLGTSATITINYDDTSSDATTAFETHANIASGDVTITGGPLPDVDLTIEFTGDLANTKIPEPTSINKSGLTGGTGVGLMWQGVRPGHPRDGSVAP